jgi:hypothetical protein
VVAVATRSSIAPIAVLHARVRTDMLAERIPPWYGAAGPRFGGVRPMSHHQKWHHLARYASQRYLKFVVHVLYDLKDFGRAIF